MRTLLARLAGERLADARLAVARFDVARLAVARFAVSYLPVARFGLARLGVARLVDAPFAGTALAELARLRARARLVDPLSSLLSGRRCAFVRALDFMVIKYTRSCPRPNLPLQLSRPGFGPGLKPLGQSPASRRHGSCKIAQCVVARTARQPPCRAASARGPRPRS
jgi:hypothetical protein